MYDGGVRAGRRAASGRAIIWVEATGFMLLALLDWLDEVLDLPHTVFGAPATPVNYEEVLIESSAIALLGAAVMAITVMLLKRIRGLERFVHVCSNCRKLRLPGTDPFAAASWVSADRFIQTGTDSDVSHGLCPECAKLLLSEAEKLIGEKQA